MTQHLLKFQIILLVKSKIDSPKCFVITKDLKSKVLFIRGLTFIALFCLQIKHRPHVCKQTHVLLLP